MEKSIFIVDHFTEIANATNAALQAKSFGYTVYNKYGHPREIAQYLQELSNSPTEGDKKFPIIMMFTDITINKNIVGFYGSVSLHFLICNFTEPTYTSEQRTELNFKPILHPIKDEFVNQIEKHKGFTFPDVPRFLETDMYFYGSTFNNKNVFNDYIDCIELRNFQINLTSKICL